MFYVVVSSIKPVLKPALEGGQVVFGLGWLRLPYAELDVGQNNHRVEIPRRLWHDDQTHF